MNIFQLVHQTQSRDSSQWKREAFIQAGAFGAGILAGAAIGAVIALTPGGILIALVVGGIAGVALVRIAQGFLGMICDAASSF
ncbi:hypothetical protein GCM10025791_11450 [Halioxenophilus aromaticivorans]|uniref:Uncharacterized protein n=1 Tax=Halioxenophilus aromaticivorans TaxID=1306992 RepID=A0AAV3TZF8_9ALTE